MKRFDFARKLQLLTALCLLTMPSVLWAHAFLDHAEPAVGAEVPRPPVAVKIWFTQNIEPAFSAIQVKDRAGKEVDNQDTHLDAQNKTLLVVSLPSLPAGAYDVTWHVVSVDTHRTQGHFKFTVR